MIISSTRSSRCRICRRYPTTLLKDLVGVTQTTLLTYAFVVNPATGIGSIQELIARAKKEPGKLNYASAGNGSGQHLYVELLKSAADMNLNPRALQGRGARAAGGARGRTGHDARRDRRGHAAREGGEAARALVHGERAARAAAGAVPFDSLFPGLGIPGWHGIFGDRGTPKPILDKLAADIRAVLALPAVASRFRELGVEPSGVPEKRSTRSCGATTRAGARSSARTSCARIDARRYHVRGSARAMVMRSALDLDVAPSARSSRILPIISREAPARAAISCGFGRFSTTRTPSRSTARSRSMRATRPYTSMSPRVFTSFGERAHSLDQLQDEVQREFRALFHEFLEVLLRHDQELRRHERHHRSRARALVEHHLAEVLPGPGFAERDLLALVADVDLHASRDDDVQRIRCARPSRTTTVFFGTSALPHAGEVHEIDYVQELVG